MKRTNNTVRCPRCNRRQPMQGPNTIYFCEHCRAMFDDDPDEGGSFTSQNPERSAISKEEYKLRQASRKNRRRYPA